MGNEISSSLSIYAGGELGASGLTVLILSSVEFQERDAKCIESQGN